jgi:hypothetical protein
MQRSEVYKTPRLHEIELPRPGDLAEITRGHCRANSEAGLLVQIVGLPHRCFAQCADCGTDVVDYFVEVFVNQIDYAHWFKTPGPWFYPISWLKRIDPADPVQYDRVKHYRYVTPTAEQIAAANK